MPALKAFTFGATIALAIGPIALLIVRYGLTSGFRVGAMSGLGAALADFTYGLVAFGAGRALAPAITAHSQAIRLVSSAVLVAFGAWMIASAFGRPREEAADAEGTEGRRPPRAGSPLAATYALTVVNPLTVIAFLGFAPQLPLAGSPWRALGFAACLFAGSLLVQLLLAGGGAGLGRLVTDPRWVRGLNAASGAGIALFGLAGLL